MFVESEGDAEGAGGRFFGIVRCQMDVEHKKARISCEDPSSDLACFYGFIYAVIYSSKL